MYEELVKRLRELASIPEHCETVDDCIQCSKEDLCLSFTNKRIIEVATQAADAIEELQRQIDAWVEPERKALIKSLPRWIPAAERLPSSGTNVLVFEFGRVEQAYTTTYTADRSLCWVVINGGSYHRVSDANCPIKWWMPLPESPKDG